MNRRRSGTLCGHRGDAYTHAGWTIGKSNRKAQRPAHDVAHFPTIFYGFSRIASDRWATGRAKGDRVDIERGHVRLQDCPHWFYRQYQSEQADQVMRSAKGYRSLFEPRFEIFLSALLRVKARRIVIRSLACPALAL